LSYDSDVIRHIAAAAPENASTLLIGSMDLRNPSPPVLDWHLAVEQDLMAATQSGAIANWEVIQKLAANLNSRIVPAWLGDMILPVLARGQSSRPMRSLYLGLPSYASYSQSPEGLSRFLRILRRSYPFDRVIVITSLASAARYPAEFTDSGLRQAGLSQLSTEKLTGASVRVDVYRWAAGLSL
jgi:hypothetical protein